VVRERVFSIDRLPHEIDAKRGYKQAFVEQGSLASRTKAADRMRAVHWTLPEQK